MQEQILVNERGVLVSTARVVVGGTTYAMSQVTSVRSAADRTSATGFFVMMAGAVVGAPGLLQLAQTHRFDGCSGFFLLIGAGIVLLGAAAQAMAPKPKYYVVLVTAAGEVPAVVAMDPAWVQHVTAAVSHALVLRG